ncbi:MAG TPA: alanine--tRNA ligase [Bacilli bacterium]|nr:alanine--tRNA ligase [Bacilli bacterium]
MKKLTADQIRQMWLDFFKSKGHHIEPGSSLIPINDPTLLWINAGVAALKKYFDGSEIPPSRRITNAQKSIRTNDIEHVGHTARHHTFFEMLGNFSIGDYFRKEVIAFASELLFDEKWFAFSKEKLYITYHPDDLETKKEWMSHGVSEDHLIPMADNFWEIGAGPCGPDTEMFYDRGEKYDPHGLGIKLLKEDIENDRYVEIWNIVFSQFNSEPGKPRSEYKELPSKNIDTGAGLERFACIFQETDSNFETDLFWPIIQKTEKISKHKYEDNKLAFRVIADHIRTITFALADGEMFSNEGRGYVLRRLLRRAERYGRVININHPFLFELVDVVRDIMKAYYPYLANKEELIVKMIKGEEDKFLRTLANGEALLLKNIQGVKLLSAEDMFRLYDTFGFPKELTVEICHEHGVEVDMEGFNKLMEAQKERARQARGEMQSMNRQSYDLMKCTIPSEFIYQTEPIKGKVVALFVDGVQVDSISDSGEVILDKTNFYAESGGQVSDSGTLESSSIALRVTRVNKAPNKQHLHHVEVMFGEVKVGVILTAKVDQEKRLKTMRNHSSVHLLQKALSDVLGDHISQHGSYVCDEYSRFDFNHFEKISSEQLNEVERKVNQWISQAIPNDTQVLPVDEAKKLGAKALFNDKYGDVVRVVCFGDVSKEFCGGTHVKNTEDIGVFAIEFEESIAAGVRRIQARTSAGAYELIKKREAVLHHVMKEVNVTSISDIVSRLISQKNDFELTKKALSVLEDRLAQSQANNLQNEFEEKGNISLLIKFIKASKRSDLLALIDRLKQGNDHYVIILIGQDNNSISIVVACSEKAIKAGYKAGELVRHVSRLLEGSGGGRDELASGAGKSAEKIPEALQSVKELFK